VLPALLAAVVRVQGAAGASTGSDALGQFLAAMGVLRGGPWVPPNPEGGHSLWLWASPLLPLAPDLSGLMRLRGLQSALIAPFAGAAAAMLSPRRPAQAALAAGVVVAVDPGLQDTFLVAFRGYGAPELTALSALGLAAGLRGRAWGPTLAALASVAALGQHPMAAGLLLGLLLAGPDLVAAAGKRAAVVALGLTSITLIPRVLTLQAQASCGAGALACLGAVAHSSSEPGLGMGPMLLRALHDRVLVDLGGEWSVLWLGVALGPALLSPKDRADRGLLLYALGATLGVLALGLTVDSLRPYHLRALAGPLALLGAVGLSRAPGLGLLWALGCGVLLARPPLPVDPGGPARADRLAALIAPLPGPLRVEAAWFNGPVGLEPAPIVLSAVLQGQDPARFKAKGAAGLVLLCSGEAVQPPPSPGRLLWAEAEARAIAFDRLDEAAAWLGAHPTPPGQVGGALDWVKALQPDDPEVEPWATAAP
jgi:hypothetical protein